jgi:signal peptidase II
VSSEEITPAAAPAPRAALRAYRSPRAWTILLATLALGLLLDLGSKWLAFRHVHDEPVTLEREQVVDNPFYDPVPGHDPHEVIPGILQLRLVINRGAVFGIGANQRTFFIGFTLVALAAGLYVFRRLTAANAYAAHVGLGLALAGGLGNLYDRLQLGAVRDFVQVLPGHRLPGGWTWPGGNPEMFPWVFNLADVFLLVGMLMIMTHLNRQDVWRRRRREGVPAAAECVAAPAESAP